MPPAFRVDALTLDCHGTSRGNQPTMSTSLLTKGNMGERESTEKRVDERRFLFVCSVGFLKNIVFVLFVLLQCKQVLR